jgi:hypothetical protein
LIIRFLRYQRSDQNPYIEEEQTTQWPKEKGQKDKQWSTKYTYKTKDRVTRTPLKTRGELCNKRYAWMGLCLSGRSNHFWLSLIPRIPISVSSFGCIIVLFSTIVLLFVLVFNFSKEKGNLIQTWPSLPTVYTVYTMAIRRLCDIIYK